jgi:pSer/pThr/pTyr-binding forkhead associated (FHA) protein
MSVDDDDHATRQTQLPSASPDEQPTGHVADVGIVAELRAVLANGERKVLPLYTLADQLVVGRGTACEWQLDDHSLSRKHAQLRWNGHELTVEDLGSANGTRVNGKPARTPIPARPGEVIQLGTVMVTLEMRSGDNPDEQSTRLVQTPESKPNAFPQLPGLATTVRPPRNIAIPHGAPAPAVAAPAGQPQVFHPSKDAARPDEPTRPWDPRAAVYHPAEKAFDGEMMERLKAAWRTNRRAFVLGGAALWVGLLLGVWYLHDSMVQEEDMPPPLPRVAAPKVTSLEPPPDPFAGMAPLDGGAADDVDRDGQLADAIAAYDQGRMAEALGLWKRLLPDENARFMVDLIQQRLHEGGQ